MGNKQEKIVIVILAGGQGSRMGTVKQLLPWKDSTLLKNAIDQAKMSIASDIIVVLGAYASEIRSKISDKDIQFIDNRKWESGLGTSISCAINHIKKNKINATGVMILLADQPLIDTEYIDKMINAFLKSSYGMVSTKYGNREGVPALFDHTYFLELQTLDQDFGAKELIKKNKHLNLSINPNGKVLDIDTQEDYQSLLKGNSNENN